MNTQKASSENIISISGWKKLLKSPFCLMWYMEKTKRKVFVCRDGRMVVECPSLQCHCVCDTCRYPSNSEFNAENEDEQDKLNEDDLTAQIVTERGTGITRVSCDICGASWDVFSLYQVDNHCDRKDAVNAIVREFMNAVPEIIVQSANEKISVS